MQRTSLALVGQRGPETLFEQAQRLHNEADAIASAALLDVLSRITGLSAELQAMREAKGIADGIREALYRTGVEMQDRHQGIAALLGRK